MAALLKLSLLLVLAYLASAQEKNLEYYHIVKPFTCTPGTTYKLDCNYCTCMSNGNSGCTLMDCQIGRDQCIPGSVFEISGQLCKCPECGYKWHSDCFASNYCPL